MVYNLDNPRLEPVRARYCASYACRLRGLTFRRTLPLNQGLLLVQDRENRLDAAIHMLGVWMDLAVVWMNASQVVVDVRLARRWRPVYLPVQPARYVLEMAAEHQADFKIGDRIKFEETELG